MDQQQVVLQKKRAALEQELAVSDLLEELVSDADLKLAVGAHVSGLSLHNNGQFKSLLFEGLKLRQRKAGELQDECRNLAESLLVQKRLVKHLEAVAQAAWRSKVRKRLALVHEEWLTHERESGDF